MYVWEVSTTQEVDGIFDVNGILEGFNLWKQAEIDEIRYQENRRAWDSMRKARKAICLQQITDLKDMMK